MRIRKLTPLGMEVAGLSLAEITDQQVAELRFWLADRGFVVFRDQGIDDNDFVSFLARLGPLMFTVGETSVRGQAMLNVVSNVGRSTPPRSVFHTDTSYVRNPPAYTALRAVTLPRRGGETLLTDQYRAFEALPEWAKERLKAAEVLHVASGVELPEDEEDRCWQPLFRRHLDSNRTALFLSTPKRCRRLSGFDDATATRTIELLYRHSTRDRSIHRHRWRPGDVLIWDNRCTLHRADHSNVLGDRVFHRGLVRGESPVAARVKPLQRQLSDSVS